MARAIRAKFDEGLTSEEIGEALGLSPRRVRRLAVTFDIGKLKPHQRQFGFKCSARTARRIHQLAAGAGVPVGEMIDRIVGTVVGDGLDHAKRKLGRLALPTPASGGRRKRAEPS